MINSDSLTASVMAVLLVLSLLSAATDFRHLLQGDFTTQISFQTFVLAALAFLLAFSANGPLLRGGWILLGFGESIRAGAFYLNASRNAEYLAAISTLTLDVVAWALLFVSAVQWFRRVTRLRNQR